MFGKATAQLGAERLEGAGDAAADEVELGVDDAADLRHGLAQALAHGVDRATGARVAGVERAEHAEGVGGVLQLGGQDARGLTLLQVTVDDALGARVLLEAAATAAAAHAGLVWVHGYVARLAAGPEGARHEPAAHDHARTDARAQHEHHTVADARRGTGPHLAQGGRVGVVDEGDGGKREGQADDTPQAVAIERHVGDEAQTALGIHGGGNVQAQRHDVVGGKSVVGQQTRQALGHDGIGGLVVERRRTDGALRQKLALGREDPRLDAGSANVDSKCDFHRGSLLGRRLGRPQTIRWNDVRPVRTDVARLFARRHVL